MIAKVVLIDPRSERPINAPPWFRHFGKWVAREVLYSMSITTGMRTMFTELVEDRLLSFAKHDVSTTEIGHELRCITDGILGDPSRWDARGLLIADGSETVSWLCQMIYACNRFPSALLRCQD